MQHTSYIALLPFICACFVDAPDVADASSDSSGSGNETTAAGDVAGDGHPSSTTDAGEEGGPSSSAGPGDSEDTAGDSTGAGGSSDDESSTSGPWSCEINDQCAPGEVCSEGSCIDAWLVPHALRVTAWDEPCDGAGTNTFFVRVGTFDSAVVGCPPQAWPGDWFTVGPGASVRLDFYEKGGAPNPDQLVTQWCWDAGMGCGPIPKAVLQAGEATAQWGTWTASIELQPL